MFTKAFSCTVDFLNFGNNRSGIPYCKNLVILDHSKLPDDFLHSHHLSALQFIDLLGEIKH